MYHDSKRESFNVLSLSKLQLWRDPFIVILRGQDRGIELRDKEMGCGKD